MTRPGAWPEGPYPVGPEALAEAPRRVTWTVLTRVGRIGLFTIFLLGPACILYLGWDAGKDFQDLADQGRPVQGRVTQKYTHQAGRTTSYHVQYVIEVDGRFYSGVDSIGEAEFASYGQGSPCDVTYLPSHPEKNCLGQAANRAQSVGVLPFVLAGVIVVLIGGSIVWWESGLRRERFLARWGVPAVGRVVTRGTGVGRGGHLYWIRYFYHAGAAAALEAVAYVPKEMWDRLAEVETVTVLYDPEAPEKSLPVCALRYVELSLGPVTTATRGNLAAVARGPAPEGIKTAL